VRNTNGKIYIAELGIYNFRDRAFQNFELLLYLNKIVVQRPSANRIFDLDMFWTLSQLNKGWRLIHAIGKAWRNQRGGFFAISSTFLRLVKNLRELKSSI
jgi:hypothetical protein